MEGEQDRLQGTCVLLAGYGYHSSPFYASRRNGLSSYLLRLQIEGVASALVQGKTVALNPGDLLLLSPGDEYMLSIRGASAGEGPSGDYYVFSTGPFLDAVWDDYFPQQKATIPLSHHTLEMWRQLVWQFRGVSKRRDVTMDYLLRALCTHLADEIASVQTPTSAAESVVAYRMRSYLENHAGDTVSLQAVADHVGLSVSRSAHLFKEAFGVTMVQFLQEVRLKMACDRIRFSAMSLEEAAETSGFRSYSYFYRVFRSRYGMSPKEFRAKLN